MAFIVMKGRKVFGNGFFVFWVMEDEIFAPLFP